MNKLDKAKNLKELQKLLTPDRQELLTRFLERKWFKNTDFSLQKEILTLPEDWEGYLADLVNRPDEYDKVDVLRFIKLSRGNFFIVSVFEVRSNITNQRFTYEFVSPKEGKNPGYRGILLIRESGLIKYFVIKKTPKFAAGKFTYDTLGGFIQFKQNQLLNLPLKIENEIKRELGIGSLQIERFIDLGQLNVDISMTNKHSGLFAAIIDVDDSKKIKSFNNEVFETKKIGFNLVVEPIEKLNEYINIVDDSYFLAIILRLSSMKIISI